MTFLNDDDSTVVDENGFTMRVESISLLGILSPSADGPTGHLQPCTTRIHISGTLHCQTLKHVLIPQGEAMASSILVI